ncbi:high-affinity iron transporter FtrA [Aspergillus ellipticus CBS 707.79]|uniref:High-affinity iron transporter FtrA n=1 Tax=Aspergillus ellipticus CBS 707.79 TaxID=1448320 RepID=A0A319DE59_9EURO|nr:high-affinity iron transporter FtrA [Aspergillus ellipticus CBS 707.79]
MANGVFAVTVFFICFRECLESVIIVSVLLSFLKQTLGSEGDVPTLKRLNRQVWYGVALGLFLCLCVGGRMIGAFYGLDKDAFTGSEDIWEGIFGFIASIIISIMGAGLLRVSKLQDKWRIKLSLALEEKKKKHVGWMARFKDWGKKNVMFLLPFVTVLREGLEAVVYVGGVGLGLPATSFPLAVVCGLLAGIFVGYLLYKCGNTASLQYFLIVSNLLPLPCLRRQGSGAGSYDIRQSVWHVNCCNPELGSGGGWGIFNALFGWTNSATYGSVLGYNLYWLCIITAYVCMWYNERYDYIPVISPCMRRIRPKKAASSSSSSGVVETAGENKEVGIGMSQIATRGVDA